MQYILAAALQQAGSRQPQPQLVLVTTRSRGQQPVHKTSYGIEPAAG